MSSESVSSDTDTDLDDNVVIGSEVGDNVWSAMDALMLLQLSMKSSLFTEDKIYDMQEAFF